MNTPQFSRLLLRFGLAVAGAATASAVDGIWANPAVIAQTLTSTASAGVYTASNPLSVGDAVIATQTAGGLTIRRLYYVVAVNGSDVTLSATPGGAAIAGTTTAGTTITANGVPTWHATGATNTQSAASWDAVPGDVDALATIGANALLANNALALKEPVTIGTLNFSASNADLNLASSNDGASTVLSALTFATSAGTPTINVSGNKVLRLGLNDASYTQGRLKLAGTQGLVLNALQANGTTAGNIRIEDMDWTGFTDGAGSVGTLTLQAGNISTQVTNALGSGVNALNLTIGNASSASGAIAPELVLSNGKDIQVNNLNGTAVARVSGATRTLTIGAGGGTNVDFLGTIGLSAAGVNTATNLTKAGAGTQTISGSLVGTGANVNVTGGTLVLNGNNSFTGTVSLSTGATLKLGSTTALGTATLGVSLIQGTIDFNGFSPAGGAVGDKSLLNATLTNSSATAVDLTALGTIGATATRTFTVTGLGNITLGQAFTGAYSVIKNGPNTLVVSGGAGNNLALNSLNEGVVELAKAGFNAINGATATINGGTLRLAGSGNNQISNNTSVLINSGALDVNGRGEAIAGLNGAGGQVTNSSATAGTLYLGGSTGGSASGSYAGVIADGAGVVNLTKEGSGTQTLAGLNTYSGPTTITTGTLALSGAGLIGSGGLVLAAAGTFDISAISPASYALGNLGGTGAINATAKSVSVSGSLVPTGAITVTGDLALSGTTASTFTVSDVLAPSLAVSGALALDGQLAILPAASFSFADGQSYDLYNAGSVGTGLDAVSVDGTPLVANTGVWSGSASGLTYTFTEATGVLAISTTPVITAPAAPTALNATAGNAQVALSWTASANTDTYTIKRGTTSGAHSVLSAGVVTGTTYTDTTALNGTTYYYVVAAVNAGGTSADSNEASATPALPLTSLQSWRVTHFGAADNAGNGADEADPDGDGRVNLLEYATGTVPTVSDKGQPVAVAPAGSSVSLTFNHIGDPALVYKVQTSSALTGAWTDAATYTGYATSGTQTYTDTTAPAPGRYVRLSVSY